MRQLPSRSRHEFFRFPGGRAQRLPARCIADSDDAGLCFELLVVVVVVVLNLLFLFLLLLLFIVVLDFVDGTGAGGVGAVRGGNLKK